LRGEKMGTIYPGIVSFCIYNTQVKTALSNNAILFAREKGLSKGDPFS
jgi:hypothetical protein